MVCAWSVYNQIVPAQEKVTEKSNEITAIPLPLKSLVLKGAIISIDAMGCQQSISNAIREADYISALKSNHESLFLQAKNEVTTQKINTHSNVEKGHGRITNWEVPVKPNLEFIDDTHLLRKLKSLVRVTTTNKKLISKKPT